MKNKQLAAASLLLIPALFTGCASPGDIQKQQANTLFSLTKEHFAQTVEVKDSPLDAVAVLDTSKGFQEKRGILGIVWSDSFLRGFIDKQTGKKSYQVYIDDTYYSPSWRFYNTVNYQTSSGLRTVPLTKIASNVNSCSSGGNCFFEEVVGFEVDEEVLRSLANQYKPGVRNPWLFKLSSRAGVDLTDGISTAEIAGLLERMDNYKTVK